MILSLIYYALQSHYMYFAMRKISIFYKSKTTDPFVSTEECMCIGPLLGFAATPQGLDFLMMDQTHKASSVSGRVQQPASPQGLHKWVDWSVYHVLIL